MLNNRLKIALLRGLIVSAFIGATSLAEPQISTATDLQTMQTARKLFGKGQLNDAIKMYSSISPNSEFWLDAIEERAWGYARQGKFEGALADLKSLTHQSMAPLVHPEAHFLSALISYKTCSYKDVVEKIESFRKAFLPRIQSLENLQSANAAKVKTVDYPRHARRDKVFSDQQRAGNISGAQERLRQLAKLDLSEIKETVQKFKILEVEVLHRATIQDIRLTKNALDFSDVDLDKRVSFPADNNELWLDEIGLYEVKTQACAN
jgi:hypothetical protein